MLSHLQVLYYHNICCCCTTLLCCYDIYRRYINTIHAVVVQTLCYDIYKCYINITHTVVVQTYYVVITFKGVKCTQCYFTNIIIMLLLHL